MKNIIFVVTITCAQFAAFGQSMPNLLNMPMASIMIDSGAINGYNLNNSIYIPGRSFSYKYTFQKNGDAFFCAAFNNDSCRITSKVPCIDWKFTKDGTVNIQKNIYPINLINVSVFRSNGGHSLQREQTVIKYEYLNSQNRIFQGEQTTVVEDSARIFLHPPRSYAFSIIEFNPFPEFRFPLTKGKKWTSFISFPAYFFSKAKLPYLSDQDLYHVDFEYLVGEIFNVSTALGNLPCTEIIAVGKSKLGRTVSKFMFNEKYGVVRVHYDNIDSSSLEMELVGITDNLN